MRFVSGLAVLRRLLVFGAALAAMTLLAVGAQAERRVALVIGNSAYNSAAALRNPRNDANDMAETLKKFGFEVTLGLDLDQGQFAGTIEKFARTLDGADVALFFYAGHGVQINEKNYLVSVNAQLSNEFLISSETIELDAIVGLMESKVATNIVFLDACRNNPLAENLKRNLAVMHRTVAVGKGLARMEPTSRDTMIAYAAAPGQEAADGGGRNSPFTAALLKHMPESGVEISVMLKLVAADVRQATRNEQRPQQLSDTSRRFYFVGGPAVAEMAPRESRPAPAAPSPARNAQSAEERSLEIAFWNSARAANECDAMRLYLQRYPKGLFLELAKLSEIRLCTPDRTVTMVEKAPEAKPPPAPPVASNAPAPPIAAKPPAAPAVTPPVLQSSPTPTPSPAPPPSAKQTTPAPATPPPATSPPPVAAAPAPPPTQPAEPAAQPPSQQQLAVVKPPAAPAPPAQLAGSSANSFRDCERCPEMVNLPGGQFSMGSNDDPSEKPPHDVTVAAFALGRYPVTIGEWRRCVADKACGYEPAGDDNLPVYNVSWTDTQEYVVWLSKTTQTKYRLPSEAEWEYAARANTTTKFWWGNSLMPNKAACKGCGTDASAALPVKVGAFAPNPLGLHDMAGGIAQWVADCWVKDYQGAPRNGAARELPNCRQHVLRGGSWKNDSTYMRSSSRDYYDTGVRYLTHGFRVARAKGN
jgi:formylglycine-generating enzyme required for sulfatase activity